MEKDNVFKKLRKSRGLSQKALGDRLGLGQGTVSQWEVGRTMPDLQTVIALADFYGVSTDFLLGRTDNPLSIVPRETPYVEVTPFEKQILEAYRALPDQMQIAVCRMLQIEHPAELRAKAKKA